MSRPRLRLGIDLDGVCADFNVGWTRRYNAAFGTGLVHTDVVAWDGVVGLTHFEDMDEFWSWARAERPSFFRDLPVVPGALETLQELARRRHRIVVITAKPRWAVPDTLAWLAEHELPVDEVHFTFDKPSVPADVYLDDAPSFLRGLVERRPGATVCRFVRPWNEPVGGAVDVAGWTEFAEVVEELETARARSS
ncbi:MAG: 5' nucleotidase, NT5C type [Nitriliruptorales bacterium]